MATTADFQIRRVVSYNLDPLKGITLGSSMRVAERDTRSLDSSSCEAFPKLGVPVKG